MAAAVAVMQQQQVEGGGVAGHGHCQVEEQAEEQCDREAKEQSVQEESVLEAVNTMQGNRLAGR